MPRLRGGGREGDGGESPEASSANFFVQSSRKFGPVLGKCAAKSAAMNLQVVVIVATAGLERATRQKYNGERKMLKRKRIIEPSDTVRISMPTDPVDFDYIVIGSGFGGSVSALRLAEKGYSVAVVERGKRWGNEDFPKTNWNFRKFLWMPKLLCYGIQAITLLRDTMILHGCGVGGGSLVYANTLLVPPDEIFQDLVGGRWETGRPILLHTTRRLSE